MLKKSQDLNGILENPFSAESFILSDSTQAYTKPFETTLRKPFRKWIGSWPYFMFYYKYNSFFGTFRLLLLEFITFVIDFAF